MPAQTLLIEGPDARAFAHAQFSSNVNALEVGRWQFSAWLSPQGRVRSFFHLIRVGEDRYLLLLRGGDGASLGEALRRYVFRAKLTFTESVASLLATGPALPLHTVTDADDVVSIGCDTHSMQLGIDGVEDVAWRALQLQMGWPWLPESALDELLPAALSLQRLAAVVVDKGCYPGQEIVARLHFRGGHKRHLHSGTLSQSLLPGHLLRIGGNVAGQLLDVLTHETCTEAQMVLSDDVAARMQQGEKDLFDDMLHVEISKSWPV